MIAISKKRLALWWAATRPMSLFVLICGVVAIFYFFYRVGLVAYPVVMLSENLLHPSQNAAIVCAEESEKLHDPTPVVSDTYQKRVLQQRALTKNLVTNPSITARDASGAVLGYSHSVDAKTSVYSYEKDTDEKRFLRVTSTKDTSANGSSPAWLPDTISLNDKATYRYGLEYRSTTPVHITIETRPTPHGNPTYSYITTLPATDKWQSFTMHTTGVASLRVITSGTKKGRVDTRAFRINQIPDAQLNKGIVSVTFDDGWKSVSNVAQPLLDKYDIRTTQYIIADVAAHGVSGYMNLDDITKLRQAGHEIGSHSLTHCNQTDLSAPEITDNASRSKQMFELGGLGPIKSFAYPMGQYDEKTQAIFPKTYDYIRTSDAGYNDRYFDETNIRSMGVGSATTEEDFKKWIEHAKTTNQWLVLVYHRVDESGAYTITHEKLERQLSLIAQSGLTVSPLVEAADAIRKEAPVSQKTPHELPRTGHVETTTQILGIGALVASSCYWQRSRRERLGR